MRTVEQYWESFEKLGFIREKTDIGLKFSLPPELGHGGFEIWGDLKGAMVCISDVTMYKPFVVLESVHEKILEFGQFYMGDVSFYKKKTEIYPIDHGLNFLVNHPYFCGYKRMEPHTRLLNIGIVYREKFFDRLSHALPDDFWETAAAVLNPDPINLPAITFICDQIKNCRLSGTALKLFVEAKCLEAFGITLDYVYAHREKPQVRIGAYDRTALEVVKEKLQRSYAAPPQIGELARRSGLNQQKLLAGFKQIYGYVKRLRMERAAELLQGSDMPVREIAKAVGYYGDGHFQGVFKSVYGTTPAKMRDALQRGEEALKEG